MCRLLLLQRKPKLSCKKTLTGPNAYGSWRFSASFLLTLAPSGAILPLVKGRELNDDSSTGVKHSLVVMILPLSKLLVNL